MRTAVTRAALYAPALLAFMLVPGRAMAGGGRPAADPKASSDEKKKDAAPKDAEQAPTVVPPGESGLVVIRDSATGELSAPVGNEASELLRAVPANNQSDEGLVQVALPEGGYTVNLQGRFQNYFMVTVQPDGTLKASCVDHEPAGAHDHAPQVKPAPQGEER